MREITFRGKRIDNGEWVYGDICHHDGVVSYIGQRPFDGSMVICDLIPETVGQSTGREDANGNTIYEFDIVKDIQTGKIKTVVWALNGFVLKSAEGFYEYTYHADEYEVIGNIHEGVTE